MINIQDKNYEPNVAELTSYIEDKAKNQWNTLISYLDNLSKIRTEMKYSKCMAKPGWNLKYKKKSKALCTLYPDKTYFTALIVLNENDREWFVTMKDNYTSYVQNLYNQARLFNGTIWLMIEVTNDEILADVIRLIQLKEE